MRNRSSTLPRLAGLLLAGVSATYAVGLAFSQSWDASGVGWALLQVWVSLIPLVFLLVALTVLFQRLHDRNAWVMALMFCGFMSLMNPGAAGASPALPGFMMAYRLTLLMMAPGLFGFFFLVFPARSRLDEIAPWLKWLLVGFGAFLVLTGAPWRPLLGQPFSDNLAGETMLSGRLALWRAWGVFGNVFLGTGVGVVALVGHAVRAASSEVRRKARVLAWGTVAAIAPALVIAVVELAGSVPDWLPACALLAFPLMPLSFAYAVVRHRVMAVPVLVQRGARYLLVQRGLAVVTVASSLVVAVALAMLAQRWLPAGSDVGLPVAVVAAGLLGVGVARAGRGSSGASLTASTAPSSPTATRPGGPSRSWPTVRGRPRIAPPLRRCCRPCCAPRSGRCRWPSISRTPTAGSPPRTRRGAPASSPGTPGPSRRWRAGPGPRSCPRRAWTTQPTSCIACSRPCGRSAWRRWSTETDVSWASWRWAAGSRRSRTPARTSGFSRWCRCSPR